MRLSTVTLGDVQRQKKRTGGGIDDIVQKERINVQRSAQCHTLRQCNLVDSQYQATPGSAEILVLVRPRPTCCKLSPPHLFRSHRTQSLLLPVPSVREVVELVVLHAKMGIRT